MREREREKTPAPELIACLGLGDVCGRLEIGWLGGQDFEVNKVVQARCRLDTIEFSARDMCSLLAGASSTTFSALAQKPCNMRQLRIRVLMHGDNSETQGILIVLC